MSRSSEANAVVELVIVPGSTDHLEVRVTLPLVHVSETVVARSELVARGPISDPGNGSPAEPETHLYLQPRDAEMFASAIREAARRALELGAPA